MFRAVCAVLLLACSALAQTDDSWITVIYKQDFGSSVTFYCNTSVESNEPPEGSLPERWMLNDLVNIPKPFNDSKYAVSNDGWRFTIYDVNADDFGIYHCMMMTKEMEWYLVKLGLNVKGPYYEDLWEKYQTNFIIGISAFFGVLFFGFGILMIYKNRYIMEEDEEEAKPIDAFTVSNGHSNSGYLPEKEGFGQEKEGYENTML